MKIQVKVDMDNAVRLGCEPGEQEVEVEFGKRRDGEPRRKR